jgi:predicted esterase
MQITTLAKSALLLSAGLLFLGAGPAKYSEETVTGPTQGNHELNCTIIRPWVRPPGRNQGPYPVIVWANGWDQGDVVGEDTTEGYKPGLIEWALDGPYIVVAANQWSVQESDVLQCLQWIVDQNADDESEYYGIVNTAKIGLAGHSQGGGAIIKAGDGEPNGFDITATIAMNPYGPSWVRSGNQDAPMFIIGGSEDTTTPTSSFLTVWEAIQSNGQGGLLAELQGGTHNDDAWAPEGEDPAQHNFGRYQEVTEFWWQIYLNDSGDLDDLEDLLESKGYWDYWFTDGLD